MVLGWLGEFWYWRQQEEGCVKCTCPTSLHLGPTPPSPVALPIFPLIFLEAKELMECHRPWQQAGWLLALRLMVEFCFSPGIITI